MTVAAITALLTTLQPLLAGTALSGVLAIATPGRIRRVFRAIQIITGIKGLASYTPEEKEYAKTYMAQRRANLAQPPW